MRRNVAIPGMLLIVIALAFTRNPLPAAARAQAPAQVRLVLMSPDAPPLDLMVDGQNVLPNFAFKAASAYVAVPAGTHQIQLTPAGQPGQVLVAAELPLRPGQALTLVALGRLAELSLFPLEDDNTPPPEGKAKVRFMHTSPDAPAVDIAVRDGPVLFPRVAFKNVAGYVSVDSGAYTLDVRPSGGATVALTVPSLTLQPGTVTTIFATGLLATNTLAAIGVPYAGPGAVRALPVVPRAGAGAPAMDRSVAFGGPGGAGVLVGVVLGLVVIMVVVRRRAPPPPTG